MVRNRMCAESLLRPLPERSQQAAHVVNDGSEVIARQGLVDSRAQQRLEVLRRGPVTAAAIDTKRTQVVCEMQIAKPFALASESRRCPADSVAIGEIGQIHPTVIAEHMPLADTRIDLQQVEPAARGVALEVQVRQ